MSCVVINLPLSLPLLYPSSIFSQSVNASLQPLFIHCFYLILLCVTWVARLQVSNWLFIHCSFWLHGFSHFCFPMLPSHSLFQTSCLPSPPPVSSYLYATFSLHLMESPSPMAYFNFLAFPCNPC